MKIELSHDSLAKRVYDRSSAEDKTRLKIINFIHQRYQYYVDRKKSKKVLLKAPDLHYIEPYIPQIVLTADLKKFIDDSKAAIQRRFIWVVVLTALCIAGLMIYGEIMRRYKNSAILAEQNVQRANSELLNTIQQKDQLNQELTQSNSYIDSLGAALAGKRSVRPSRDELFMLATEHLRKLENTDSMNEVMKNTISRQMMDIKQRDLQIAVLQKKTGQLEMERNELKMENEKLKRTQNNTNIGGNTTFNLSKATEATALTKYAQTALKDKNFDKAFHLAAAAYERDNTNKDAISLLRTLARDKMDNSYKTAPPKDIIRRLSNTNYYGAAWSERELKPYLK